MFPARLDSVTQGGRHDGHGGQQGGQHGGQQGGQHGGQQGGQHGGQQGGQQGGQHGFLTLLVFPASLDSVTLGASLRENLLSCVGAHNDSENSLSLEV